MPGNTDKAFKRLTETLGAEVVLTSETILNSRRHDYWASSLIKERLNQSLPKPAMVLQPRSVADVQAMMRVANEERVPVVPYGLGSGVCGGIVTSADVILLDLGQMNSTREIDPINMIAFFDAGKRGIDAETEVAEKGLTIGHWPQSIELSSVGGWVATRASGQFSTAYGNIEDIVYAIEAVLPNGDLLNAGKAPRASAGPDLRHLLMGSEGTLAVITGVSFSLRKAAPSKQGSIFFAKDMKSGFEAQREIIQSGWTPPVVRQYDHSESRRHFGADIEDGAVVLLMVHEGHPNAVSVEKAAVCEIAISAGLKAGPDKIVEHWMEERNKVPLVADLLKKDYVVDTIEVSAPWSDISNLYDKTTAKLAEIPNMLTGTAHSSHAYRSGVNLYFTFVARVEDQSQMQSIYEQAWQAVMQATIEGGGGIAHHHGIGRVRKNFLQSDLGVTGIATLRAVKSALDPNNIMNPGVLLPDA